MAMIGIDLGTTNSLVSHWTEDGPVIIPNVLGLNMTPSVVSIDENNEILVGQVAKERMITHPHLTASVFKRFMGTQKTYRLGKYTFSPEELSALVLKSLKADAEAYLECVVEEAIISVPAYFNDHQRKATKQAAELAGLKVERLISEPTAAAIAYGIHQKEKETKFMVFDLGGGTFDVSILEMFEGVMEVKSIAGDNYLGGEDFTALLINYFVEEHKIDMNLLSTKERAQLYKQAEICKKDISNSQSGCMSFLYQGEILEKQVDRVDYDRLSHQLLIRLKHPIERAMRDVSVTPKDLDAVILIGGATKMPVIRSVVGKMFGTLPFTSINPDEAVAMGAAIQGALKQRNQSLDELILTDVCPFTLGTDVAKDVGNDNYQSGFFLPIIERNTPIPVSRVERLQTLRDNQKRINVGIYQGESHKVEGNVKLGEMELKIPTRKAGEVEVDVRYTYDINGILEVETTIVGIGTKQRIILANNNNDLSESQINERFEALNHLKIHPRERIENQLLMARGERLYEESLGWKREHISALLQRFEAVLLKQDDRIISKEAEELKVQFEQLEGWFEFE